MPTSAISLVLSLLLATASSAPINHGHSEPHNQPGGLTLYRGHNGQSKVRISSKAVAFWKNDDHRAPETPYFSSYKCYQGDISKYPTGKDWLSFDALWDINSEAILSNNGASADMQRYIHDSILEVSGDSNVDPRLILAVIMQESSGKSSVPCTGDMPNCGLMQASYGSHSFDPSQPKASIKQMIQEGTQGTTSGGPTGQGGPGLAQFLDDESGELGWTKNPELGNPYTAARTYNSGSVAEDGNLDKAEWGVKGYANDIANRLIGWNGHGNGFDGCSGDQ